MSDLHLGYERFIEDAYVQAREALETAAGLSDMIIVPGDIFDFRHPKPETIAEAINLFRDLSRHEFGGKVVEFDGKGQIYTDKPIIVIPGTHERRSELAVDSVDLLSLAGLAVSVNRCKAVVEKRGARVERVAVFGIGGVADERFKDIIAQTDFKPEKDAFNIFMFHQTLYELLPYSKEFAKMDELPKGFDLYVDGHIHSRVEDTCHGKPFLIPGSTVITQLRESEQDGKGFYVFDTETGKYAFHKIKSRPFRLLKIDISGMEPAQCKEMIDKKIRAVIESNSGKERCVIKVDVSGEVKKGFRRSDIFLGDAASVYPDAIVDISKEKVEDSVSKTEIKAVQDGMVGNLSVRDYGLGIFLDKIKKDGYALRVGPSKLFEILSSDEKKETAVKNALQELFSDQ